ncbi:MAG: hypothetical protein ACLSE7_00985 [Lachnospirales bacterium]
MRNKNLRRLRTHVTAQTMGNLERLAAMSGYGSVGRVVDKLVRDRMVELRARESMDFVRAKNPGSDDA